VVTGLKSHSYRSILTHEDQNQAIVLLHFLVPSTVEDICNKNDVSRLQ